MHTRLRLRPLRLRRPILYVFFLDVPFLNGVVDGLDVKIIDPRPRRSMMSTSSTSQGPR